MSRAFVLYTPRQAPKDHLVLMDDGNDIRDAIAVVEGDSNAIAVQWSVGTDRAEPRPSEKLWDLRTNPAERPHAHVAGECSTCGEG